jgi:hypothetical protein
MQTNRRRAARLAARIFLFTWWPYLAFLGAVAHLNLLVVPFWRAHGDEITRTLFYDRQALLSEYEMVRDVTEQRYPNLDWTIQKGALDLERLDRETVAAIEASATREEGARAIRRFVDAFDDGHFYAVRKDYRKPRFPASLLPDRTPKAPDVISAHTPPERACAAILDLEQTDPIESHTSLAGHPDFAPIDAPAYFPSGILRTPSGRRLGVVRIGTFDYDDYTAACHTEWQRFRWTIRGSCEEKCQWDFYYLFRDRVVADFARQVERLIEARAEVFVLDLAGNGGGNDWYQAVVRTLTPRRVPCPRTALARTDETKEQIEWQAESLRAALRKGPCGTERRIIEEALRRAEALSGEVSKPCGRDWVFPAPENWSEVKAIELEEAGEEVPEELRRQTNCTALTTAEFFQCGYFSDLEIGPSRDRDLQNLLFDPHKFAFRPGLWNGPIAVIIDEDSGSAAEMAAGMLQDWAGAIVVGEPSSGSGAGYHFGRHADPLPVSGLELYMPTATSWRRDGRNYREGITPDIRVWWYEDDTWEARVKKLAWEMRVLAATT